MYLLRPQEKTFPSFVRNKTCSRPAAISIIEASARTFGVLHFTEPSESNSIFSRVPSVEAVTDTDIVEDGAEILYILE